MNWLWLLKWKRNSNINPAKSRTAAACGALCEKLLMKNIFKTTIFLLLIISMLSCEKHVDELTPFISSFQAEINGVSISVTASSPYRQTLEAYLFKNINGTDSTYLSFGSSIWKWRFAQDTIIQKSIYIYFVYHLPNDSLFDSTENMKFTERMFRQFFRLGDYTYTYLSWIKAGIVIIWYDDNGVEWASGRYFPNNTCPMSQPDYSKNNFIIINSKPVIPPYDHTFKQEIQIKFNCWVYNDSDDSLHIENAKYQGFYLY
jgi:hypothetical protein